MNERDKSIAKDKFNEYVRDGIDKLELARANLIMSELYDESDILQAHIKSLWCLFRIANKNYK